MRLASDLRVLYHLALKPVRGADHAARLDSFYAGQAEAYDAFRKRLLAGRAELGPGVTRQRFPSLETTRRQSSGTRLMTR